MHCIEDFLFKKRSGTWANFDLTRSYKYIQIKQSWCHASRSNTGDTSWRLRQGTRSSDIQWLDVRKQRCRNFRKICHGWWMWIFIGLLHGKVVTTNALILLDDLFLLIAAFASSKIGPFLEFSKQTTPFSIGSLNFCFTPTRHPLQRSGKDSAMKYEDLVLVVFMDLPPPSSSNSSKTLCRCQGQETQQGFCP